MAADTLTGLKEQHDLGAIDSLELIRRLLPIAGEAAASVAYLFDGLKADNTPAVAGMVVAEIESVARIARVPGWRWTPAAERDARDTLRAGLLKFKLHKDLDLLERAWSYVRAA